MSRHMFLASADPKSTACVCGAEYRTTAHPHRSDPAISHSDRCTCGLPIADDHIHTDATTATRTPSKRREATRA